MIARKIRQAEGWAREAATAELARKLAEWLATGTIPEAAQADRERVA